MPDRELTNVYLLSVGINGDSLFSGGCDQMELWLGREQQIGDADKEWARGVPLTGEDSKKQFEELLLRGSQVR